MYEPEVQYVVLTGNSLVTNRIAQRVLLQRRAHSGQLLRHHSCKAIVELQAAGQLHRLCGACKLCLKACSSTPVMPEASLMGQLGQFDGLQAITKLYTVAARSCNKSRISQMSTYILCIQAASSLYSITRLSQ
jgi:hypothetical protein